MFPKYQFATSPSILRLREALVQGESAPDVFGVLLKTPPFKVERLQRTKADLNRTKDKLDDFDIEVWGRHTTFTNLHAFVVRHLRSTVDPEFCTNAWTKMYEMLHACDLLPARCSTLETFHLCEAPGAFVASLNHYVRSDPRLKDVQLDWHATTLNPEACDDFERMIDDTRLMQKTQDRWLFGADNTGDLLKQENIEHFWRRFDRGLDLVTADGGINCQHDPNEQEATLASLKYSEVVCSLGLLRDGGSMVVKWFTVFEHSSVGILALVTACFESCTLTKPRTSKAGNSEVYIVAKGFKKDLVSPKLLKVLLSHVGPCALGGERTLLPRCAIGETFLDHVCKAAAYFADRQMGAIERNLNLWYHPFDRSRMVRDKWETARQWADDFGLCEISKELKLACLKRLGGGGDEDVASGRHKRARLDTVLIENHERVEGGGKKRGHGRDQVPDGRKRVRVSPVEEEVEEEVLCSGKSIKVK